MKVLRESACRELADYQYVGSSYSFIDKLLSPLQERATGLLPLWMAPNLVTAIGFLLSVGSSVLVVMLSGGLVTPCPPWALLLSGIAVFLYMNLDAMDGKQARRTHSSSPLGQLFDHGCDCFNCSFRVMSMLACFPLPATSRLALLILANCMVYAANWEEYHTGVFVTNNGLFGTTETLLMDSALHILTAVYGPEVWVVPVVTHLTGVDLLFGFSVASLIFQVLGSVFRVTFTARSANMRVGNKSLGLPLVQLLPCAALCALSIVWLVWQAPSLLSDHPALSLCMVGTHFTVLTTRVMIEHMCRAPLSVGFLLLFLAPLAGAVWGLGPALGVGHLVVLVALNGYGIVWCVGYSYAVVQQACEALSLQCFRISPKTN